MQQFAFLYKTLLAFVLLPLSLVSLASATCYAGNWPQILGPQRNAQATDEKLLDAWPKAGPQIVWKKSVGNGLAAVAVTDEVLILFHRRAGRQIVEALNPLTKKQIWRKSFTTNYQSSIAKDDGPRSVPLIHKKYVYLVSASGEVFCLSLKDGSQRWFRALVKEYRAAKGYFGIGCSPIVEDNKLVINIGGTAGAGIVALALDSGKTIWKATTEKASYSSPIATTIDGTRHLIFLARYHAISLNPKDGEVRFKYAFGKRGPTVNAASPVLVDGKLFLSASYGIGAVMLSIGKNQTKTLWKNQDCMASQYSTSIYHQGYLYGVNGRADGGTTQLRCIDPKNGKVVWEKADFGMATLILADDKLIAVKTDGTIVLIKPNAKKYQELASASITNKTVRALPALADGHLYLRDTTTLYCIRLGKPSK